MLLGQFQKLANGVRFPLDHPSPRNVERLDMGALPLIDRMHRNGIYMDAGQCRALDLKVITERDRIGEDIKFLANKKEFNPGSFIQVGKLLYGELKLDTAYSSKYGKKLGKTGGGALSTNDENLSQLKQFDPLPALILDWRELDKLSNTYTRPLPLLINPYTNRIQTTLNPVRTATGRLASSNPNCFDGETEVLTRAGWVKFKNLKQDYEPVAQWNYGMVSFVVPCGYTFGHAAHTVQVKNQHIDLVMTEDHRCLLQHRKTGDLRVFTASGYPEDWRQLHGGDYEGGTDIPFWLLRFLLAVQADGSWFNGDNLDFGFTKERKAIRLRSILEALRVGYREEKGSNNRFRFTIHSCEATRYVHGVIGRAKTIPWSFALSLSAALIKDACTEVMKWDGCITRNNHYSSNNKQNAEVVATWFTLSNRRAKLRLYKAASGSDNWQVDATQRNYSLTTNAKKKITAGCFVYCLSVPSSFLLVRRNGAVCVTGNCQNIPTRTIWGQLVRYCFKAQHKGGKETILVSGDLSQVEMVGAAHVSRDPKMLRVFHNGLDLHTFTAISMFRLRESDIEPDPEKYPNAVCPFPGGWPITWKYFKKNYRLPAKTLGFAILYGVTPEGLQMQILNAGGPYWTVEECAHFIRLWYELYVGVYEWTCEQHARVFRYQMVWDLFGRWRRIPQGLSKIKGVVSDGLREAGNMPIQSLAQGIIKLAMAELEPVVRYYERLGEICWPLLQIHDELIFEVSKSVAVEFGDKMTNIMRNVLQLLAPLGSSCDMAESWGALK